MKRNTITKAYVRLYTDNRQVKAYVEWSDGSRTEGSPRNTHIKALLTAAKRQGLPVKAERW